MKTKITLSILFLVLVVISLFCGRYGSSMGEAIQALFGEGQVILAKVVWQIRIPRIVLVSVCGGALALSGAIFQNVFKNPLASGDVIGATSGCSLGAVLAILCGASTFFVEVSAFAFGVICVLFTMFLAKQVKGNRVLNLVIAGLVMQAFTTALMMVLKIAADPYHELATIEYWLMGGFSDCGWSEVFVTSGITLVCCIGLYLLRWQIQMLYFGEEAKTLGVAEGKVRILALLLCTLLVSSVVCVAGIVSWVSLLVPHMVRQFSKEQVSKQYFLLFVCGSIFLLFCDTLARSLLVIELPISILTSLFGALFLAFLFLKRRLPL